jgi:hypothetical protein
MNPGMGGEGRDQEELSKCNAIIEQKFQAFQVIPGLFLIVIVFSLKFQLHTLIPLQTDSDITRRGLDMFFKPNSVRHSE